MIINNDVKNILNHACPMFSRVGGLGTLLQKLDVGTRDVEAIGDVAVNYAIDMDKGNVQTLTLTQNITLSATNLSLQSKSVDLIITAGGTGARTLAFDASWNWLGAMPTTLANGVKAVLSIKTVGAAATDVIAAYEELA